MFTMDIKYSKVNKVRPNTHNILFVCKNQTSLFERNVWKERWCLSKWWNMTHIKIRYSSLTRFKFWCHLKYRRCTYSLCHRTLLIKMTIRCYFSNIEYQVVPSLDKKTKQTKQEKKKTTWVFSFKLKNHVE